MTRRNNNEKQNLDCGATGICHTREKTLIHHPYNTHAVPYGGNDFVPLLLSVIGDSGRKTVAVIDNTGLYADALQSNDDYLFVPTDKMRRRCAPTPPTWRQC